MTNRFKLWATLLGCFVSTAASAETITGTFTYRDISTVTPIPIADTIVEVYRHTPGQIGWSMTHSTRTNADGKINVNVPYVGNNVSYSLRVYADTTAVRVLRMDDPFQGFYQKPGFPNTEIIQTTTGPSNVFDFSYQFADSWSSAHYNVAQALGVAKAYADARRDPFEVDPIEKLDVQVLNNANNTWFDPISHRIRITVDNAASDSTVVHEYGHYLEQKISSFYGQATFHDGCVFLSSQGGFNVANPGLAWMEGFATWFASAVGRANPNVAGLSISQGPEFVSCPTITTPDAIEDRVAGALWDLVDGAFQFPGEQGDRFCSTPGYLETDRLIFQIFDRELGHLGNQNPTLQQFLDAWTARGLDLPTTLTTFGTAGSMLSRPPTTHRYDVAAGAELAVWRPVEGNWYILQKNGSQVVQQWGMPGDIPVPADYDGDSITDVAIWRPSDGNWWVIYSATNRMLNTQWGAPTDVPLPADYDGDGEVDFAVYRASANLVIIKNDNCGPDHGISLDQPGVPVVGDFDGDGKADPGTLSGGTFSIHLATGPMITRTLPVSFLAAPALGDFDGDRRTDFALFDSMTGTWTISTMASPPITTTTFGGPRFLFPRGRSNATPVPKDYDGDGRTDLAVFYASEGLWQVNRTRDGLLTQYWGLAGDRPVPAR